MKLYCSKIGLLIFGVWFASQTGNAQITVYNDGKATVSIVSTCTVSILGNYVSKTNTAVDGKIDNQGIIQLTGDWTNNNSNSAPYNTFSTSAGRVIFNGTGTQTIGGTATTTFYNLTTNNDPAVAGDVTLATNNYVISNNLTMTRGNVNLNGRTLTLGTGTATPGTLSYTAGFLYSGTGTFTRWISATAAAMGGIANNSLGHFPMGTSVGHYRPVWIAYATNLSAGGTVSVIHAPTYPAGTTAASHADGAFGTLQGISNSSWTVSTANSFAISGSNDGIIRFGGTGFGTFVLSDLDASLAASVVGTHGAATNANTTLEVNRTALSTANMGGTWYIGTKNIVASPLPVEFISFDVVPDRRAVNVNWTTAVELNNDYFIVQRSKNGVYFEDIARVKGAGNSNALKFYSSVDNEPYSGVSFYRLKQVDFNGAFTFSKTVSVEFNAGDLTGFHVYPTLSSGDFHIAFTGDEDQQVSVTVRNILGQEFYAKEFLLDKDFPAQPVSLSGTIAPGVYTVTASSKANVFVRRIVIQ